MARKRTVSQHKIDADYWRPVEVQDNFWRRTFIDFIAPLKGIYRDPMSAGAYLLSAYFADAAGASTTFVQDPAAFGSLAAPIDRAQAESAYAKLVHGTKGLTLELCAKKFSDQCAASVQIARFAADHPNLYWELQQERAARNAKATHIEVQFFGQTIYVEQRLKLRTKRPKKTKPKID